MALWEIVALSFLAELVEISWQYAPRFSRAMERIYALYRRSIFLFFLGHTGYLYILYVALRYDLLDWPIIVAIALKTLDVFTKLELMRKIYVRREHDEMVAELMELDFPRWVWAIGPLSYPWLIYLAFVYAQN
ncbi:hypothetical protein [Nitratifractor sp.]